MTFRQLVRFEEDGIVHYGDLLSRDSSGAYKIRKLSGNPRDGFSPTPDAISTSKLLCPVEDTPIIICVGLNYKQHAKEANLTVPKYPVIFTKPKDALAGPFDDIHVHPDAQIQLDFEGELCVIISRDAKDVKEDNALDFVLGYTLGNDVSARNFQLPDVSGGQFCYAKSFDGFAPIGPAIWSAANVPNLGDLYFRTKVNGEVLQETPTSDMIWSVNQLIAHLSRGTTLRQGTVIMTGTPSGVGFFRNQFLKHGDVVEVEMDGLGKISNRVVFNS